jgi:hypothetical protein
MLPSNSVLGGKLGGKLIGSKKVQGAVKNNFRNTIGGKLMEIKKKKSSPSRPSPAPSRAPSPAPSPPRTTGSTGLNVN